MTKDTFKVEVEPAEELEYIVQSIDELDKNHGINDTKPTNEGRMYADPGKNYSISIENMTVFIVEQLKVEHKTQNLEISYRSRNVPRVNIQVLHE